jgi:hypothetical protein
LGISHSLYTRWPLCNLIKSRSLSLPTWNKYLSLYIGIPSRISTSLVLSNFELFSFDFGILPKFQNGYLCDNLTFSKFFSNNKKGCKPHKSSLQPIYSLFLNLTKTLRNKIILTETFKIRLF